MSLELEKFMHYLVPVVSLFPNRIQGEDSNSIVQCTDKATLVLVKSQ